MVSWCHNQIKDIIYFVTKWGAPSHAIGNTSSAPCHYINQVNNYFEMLLVKFWISEPYTIINIKTSSLREDKTNIQAYCQQLLWTELEVHPNCDFYVIVMLVLKFQIGYQIILWDKGHNIGTNRKQLKDQRRKESTRRIISIKTLQFILLRSNNSNLTINFHQIHLRIWNQNK